MYFIYTTLVYPYVSYRLLRYLNKPEHDKGCLNIGKTSLHSRTQGMKLHDA